jgi:hypothetical protein
MSSRRRASTLQCCPRPSALSIVDTALGESVAGSLRRSSGRCRSLARRCVFESKLIVSILVQRCGHGVNFRSVQGAPTSSDRTSSSRMGSAKATRSSVGVRRPPRSCPCQHRWRGRRRLLSSVSIAVFWLVGRSVTWSSMASMSRSPRLIPVRVKLACEYGVANHSSQQ